MILPLRIPSVFLTLLHEFVHCFQYETCEQDLKMTLDIARKAQEGGDFMWEIQHPFPYAPQDFFQSYTAFLKGLEENDKALVNASRRALRSYLGLHDYEYMVWQEAKEGFARWVENQIKRLLGLPENKGDWESLTAGSCFTSVTSLILLIWQKRSRDDC